MIVHHEARWIYLGVPKTASTMLHRFLPTHGGVVHGDQHAMKIPDEWREYRVLVSVMNPFRRATALWRMWGKDVRKGAWWTEGCAPELVDDFRAFVSEFFVSPREPDARPTSEWPMSRWIDEADLDVEPEVLRAEHLARDLLRLGILDREVELPVENKSGNERWWECYDDALVAEVRRWAARDFERFGYPTDLETAIRAELDADAPDAGPSGLAGRVRARLQRLRGGRS